MAVATSDAFPLAAESDGMLARVVIGSASGDATAAESELYRRFAPRVRLYGVKHLGDRTVADDLAQQVMLTVIERLRRGDIRDPDQIGSFVLGTSRMTADGMRRTERRRGRDDRGRRPRGASPGARVDEAVPREAEVRVTEQAGCPSFGELAEYWTADVTDADAEHIEAHVFACERCARLLERVDRMRTAIRVLSQAGGFRAFVTDGLLNALVRDGVRVRMYALAPGESVQCTAWADDELLVARLRGDFSGVGAVDADMRLDTGEPWGSATDVPVREGATELLLALPAESVRNAPEVPMRLTLRPSGIRDAAPIAEYVFDHRGAHERS